MSSLQDVFDYGMPQALKLKSHMLKQKPILMFAKTHCKMPNCKGMMHVKLHPYNKHMRVWCDTCELTIME